MDEKNIDYVVAVGSILSFEKVTTLIVCLSLLYAFSKAVHILSRKFSDHTPSRNTLILQVATLVSFFTSLFGGAFVIYYSLKPPQEVSLAILGSATVAIGLSLRDLVASLISGVTIIVDPPFQVGDRIFYKDYYGEVTYIGLRAVRIRTLNNQIVTIPNSSFMNDSVVCQNPGKTHICVATSFYVGIESDIEKCKEVLYELVCTSRYVYLSEPININVEQAIYADVLYLHFNVRAYVHNARYEKDFQTDLYERASRVFVDENISYSFKWIPHVDSV